MILIKNRNKAHEMCFLSNPQKVLTKTFHPKKSSATKFLGETHLSISPVKQINTVLKKVLKYAYF